MSKHQNRPRAGARYRCTKEVWMNEYPISRVFELNKIYECHEDGHFIDDSGQNHQATEIFFLEHFEWVPQIYTFGELLNALNKAGHKELHAPWLEDLYPSNNWVLVMQDQWEIKGTLGFLTVGNNVQMDTPEEGEDYGLVRFEDWEGDHDLSEPTIAIILVDGYCTHASSSFPAQGVSYKGNEPILTTYYEG